mmetsp:Transcript_4253/g.8256  ORF Transcript_4253/g.8256 Transcript_4253/m.8256 type:complete len:227 (+) Transcript_4253:1313-1993(+)
MRFKELVQLRVLHVRSQILHVDIRERIVGFAAARTFLPRHEETDKHLLAIEKHPVHLGHSEVGGFLRLVVHKTVTLRCTLVVGRHLAGQNVTKRGEGVVQRLVVDRLIQRLNEDVAGARLAKAGVTVAPHYAARLVLDQRVIHRLQRTLSIHDRVEVDVSVAKRAAAHGVTAHPNRRDRSDSVEQLEEQSLGDLGVQIADIEGGSRIGIHDFFGVFFFSAAGLVRR